MRQNCTQPVTPSATHTCSVPSAQHHDQRDQQQQARHRGQHRHDEEHGVVDAPAEVAGRHAEQQRDGDDDQARQAADQQGHAHALERAIDHVAAEDVGAEQMRAGIAQRLAAVEADARERRGVARLLEGLGLEDAVDDGPRAGRPRDCRRRGPADPGDRIQQRDEHEDGEHRDGDRAGAATARWRSRARSGCAQAAAPARSPPATRRTTTPLETRSHPMRS